MEVRINRFLSEAGVCSRRAADKMISEGRVTIDGEVACLGSKADEASIVCVDGRPVTKVKKDILIAFNKPVGIVCTATDKQGKNNVIDYINFDERIYPVGRLDKDSEGLLLLTNNGDLTYRLLKADGEHEKEYIVETDKPVTKEFIDRLANGIYLKDLDKTTAGCKVKPIFKNNSDKTKTFSIILVQGLNRQIRRMCEECGYKVRKLKRIRIMNIMLGNLKTGEYRYVKGAEYEKLLKSLNPEGRNE